MTGTRLASTASPYLRAHADNPVDWYPWGPDAFAEAARRNVPVLISIGYSTCHWCHVMARESFEDEATAAVMNDGLVSIKVDREEHPAVDDVYMAAAHAFTKNLGWPLTVFTRPDGAAFFAGTYFPSQPQPGTPTFGQVLAAVKDAWATRRDEVDKTADAVNEALAAASVETIRAEGEPRIPALVDVQQAARTVLTQEDRTYGGFARADAAITTPKFPSVPVLRFLQAPALAEAVPEAAAAAARALAAMVRSPLADPIDGGFFRYATRRDWTVPHYERMLTDNAGLLQVALDAGDTDTADGVARFLTGVLQLPDGGFAAAQDSESQVAGRRSEGGYYGLDAAGRAAETAPAVDGKLITGWNGMAIAALAHAGRVRENPSLVEAARRAAQAVAEANTLPDGLLRRASLHGLPSPAAATLEDYGLYAQGLVELARATGEDSWMQRAAALVDLCVSAEGTLQVPGGDDPVLAAHNTRAPASVADGDHPSGASAVAGAALALWQNDAGQKYRRTAAGILRTHGATAVAEPFAHGALLRVAAELAR